MYAAALQLPMQLAQGMKVFFFFSGGHLSSDTRQGRINKSNKQNMMCDAVFLVNRNPNSDPETRDTDHHAATELHGIVANPKTSWRSDSVPTAQILGKSARTPLALAMS